MCTMPKLDTVMEFPGAKGFTITRRVTTADRKAWIRAAGRDDCTPTERDNLLKKQTFRVCRQHLANMNAFEFHPTEADPLFLKWYNARGSSEAIGEPIVVHEDIIEMMRCKLVRAQKLQPGIYCHYSFLI